MLLAEITALFTIDLAYAAAITLVAGVIKGFAGFGGGMFMVPLFSILYGPVDAVIMILLLEAPANVVLLPRALRDTNWSLVTPIVIATLVSIPVGTYVLVTVDGDLLRRVIGVAVLFFVAVMYTGWRYRGALNATTSFGAGIAAGFLAGSGGMGGPVLVMYLMADPDTFAARVRGSMLTIAMFLIAYMLLNLAMFDAVSSAPVWRSVVLVPMIMVGAWAGTRLFLVASELFFRRFALLFIGVAGLIATIK